LLQVVDNFLGTCRVKLNLNPQAVAEIQKAFEKLLQKPNSNSNIDVMKLDRLNIFAFSKNMQEFVLHVRPMLLVK
jgi:hypothetical protein